MRWRVLSSCDVWQAVRQAIVIEAVSRSRILNVVSFNALYLPAIRHMLPCALFPELTVMDQIIVENLTKTFRVVRRQPGLRGSLQALVKPEYQEVHALDRISFSIAAGELVGYIGPNGAGKSTTVKV